MMNSVEGIYRNGKVELLEEMPEEVNEARVIVTFLPANSVDLQARGIDKTQAEELRWRLNSIADDWNRPEMDAYDEL